MALRVHCQHTISRDSTLSKLRFSVIYKVCWTHILSRVEKEEVEKEEEENPYTIDMMFNLKLRCQFLLSIIWWSIIVVEAVHSV